MTSKKDQPSAFESIRVLGKKAQELIHRAREERERQRHVADEEPPPPEAENDKPIVTIAFSTGHLMRSAFTILAIVTGVWLCIQLADTIMLFILSLFLAAIIDPGVRAMERWGIPRGVAILILYLGALLLFSLLVLSLVPIIGLQIQELISITLLKVNAFILQPEVHLPLVNESVNIRLTEMAQSMLQDVSIDNFLVTVQNFGTNLSSAAKSLAHFATNLAGSVLSFFIRLVVVLVIAFFIQIEREGIRAWVRSFLPYRFRGYLDDKSDAIHYKIAQWVQGQLILSLSIGLLVFLALIILRMKYALTLAALASFTEFIPYMGPLIGAVPAVLIAFTEDSLGKALVVAGVYYVIQWCENNLLVPLIMKRAVGLSPIVVMLAMLVGVSFPTYLNPILGILLAVPGTTIASIFLDDWRQQRQRRHAVVEKS